MNAESRQYAAMIREHLLTKIMPFWDQRCVDDLYGGYLTCFDRQGNVTDTDKYIWFQGRQLYVYALLYNRIEKRSDWLYKAKRGYDFLVKNAYAGAGRWNYQTTRDGQVKVGTNSIYSDYHVAQGLGEYMLATGCQDEKVMAILTETFDALERNTRDPLFKDIYENTWSPKFIWHDMYLTALNTATIAGQALGEDKVGDFQRHCLDKIMNWFMRDEYQLIFEQVTRDNRVELSQEGRFINPGHSLESMWFCIDAASKNGDKKLLEKARRAIDWTYKVAWDREYGGIFSYLDAGGETPIPMDWHKETNSMWDDKVWWVNAESLCSFALAYVSSNDKKYFEMFQKQYDFCMKHFFDPEYGEWYERLHRDGSVKVSDKGTKWKCAYHLVRSLVQIIIAFENAAAGETSHK